MQSFINKEVARDLPGKAPLEVSKARTPVQVFPLQVLSLSSTPIPCGDAADYYSRRYNSFLPQRPCNRKAFPKISLIFKPFTGIYLHWIFQ